MKPLLVRLQCAGWTDMPMNVETSVVKMKA
jgi:hypothetical protein